MRRDGFFPPPASWFIDCLKGKSGPFRFPRSFAGAEMGPGEEKPAGHTLVWPRVLTKHGPFLPVKTVFALVHRCYLFCIL